MSGNVGASKTTALKRLHWSFPGEATNDAGGEDG
jgi:hypothetical protein